jgi:hypothetical protein
MAFYRMAKIYFWAVRNFLYVQLVHFQFYVHTLQNVTLRETRQSLGCMPNGVLVLNKEGHNEETKNAQGILIFSLKR